MGLLGGDWVDDNANDTSYELHTDIDVHFTMSGQTDTGLTFGASIDLDETDGDGAEGASAAFDNRSQGGEEIFISGSFGTLTMGDTDGALDWALQEIGIGGTLGDAHTIHDGYSGNSFADGDNDFSDGDGQIVRYDHSFGDFAVAFSANIDDEGADDDLFAVGAKYSASLAAMELGIGVGYTQLIHWEEGTDDALGISVDANFDNGIRVILNSVNMGDSNQANSPNYLDDQYIGVGLGYTMDNWTIAANWGQYSEDDPNDDDDRGQSGYAIVANYDLGGGAQVQFGYSKSSCKTETVNSNQIAYPVIDDAECNNDNLENSALSLGVAMSF